jgi:hypothetical protein
VYAYTGERRVDSPLKGEDIAYFVDNSSPYTYIDRGFDIHITPPLTPKGSNEVIP